jgi:hypothetical protein
MKEGFFKGALCQGAARPGDFPLFIPPDRKDIFRFPVLPEIVFHNSITPWGPGGIRLLIPRNLPGPWEWKPCRLPHSSSLRTISLISGPIKLSRATATIFLCFTFKRSISAKPSSRTSISFPSMTIAPIGWARATSGRID